MTVFSLSMAFAQSGFHWSEREQSFWVSVALFAAVAALGCIIGLCVKSKDRAGLAGLLVAVLATGIAIAWYSSGIDSMVWILVAPVCGMLAAFNMSRAMHGAR